MADQELVFQMIERIINSYNSTGCNNYNEHKLIYIDITTFMYSNNVFNTLKLYSTRTSVYIRVNTRTDTEVRVEYN